MVKIKNNKKVKWYNQNSEYIINIGQNKEVAEFIDFETLISVCLLVSYDVIAS